MYMYTDTVVVLSAMHELVQGRCMSQCLPGTEASHATSPDVMDDKQRTVNKYFFGENGHLEYPQATLYARTHFEYIFTKKSHAGG